MYYWIKFKFYIKMDSNYLENILYIICITGIISWFSFLYKTVLNINIQKEKEGKNIREDWFWTLINSQRERFSMKILIMGTFGFYNIVTIFTYDEYFLNILVYLKLHIII